jgi:hypothetical protein
MSRAVQQQGTFGLAPLKLEGTAVGFDGFLVSVFPPLGREGLGLRGSLVFAGRRPHNMKEFLVFCERLCVGHDREISGRKGFEQHLLLKSSHHGGERSWPQEAWRQTLCIYEPWLGVLGGRKPFIDASFDHTGARITLWGWDG